MFFGHADCFFCHADFADDADFSLMLFLFPTDFTDLHRFLTCSVWDFADFRPARFGISQIGAASFTFLPFYFFTFISVWDFADGRSFFYLFTFLPLNPFYFFTFLPFYLYQVYKMLMNCGFPFIKSVKLRTKMFFSTKKIRKFPPPFNFFYYFCDQ